MTKRGRKLHQTMARRYAIARGENPDTNAIDYAQIYEAIGTIGQIAAEAARPFIEFNEALYQFGLQAGKIVQTFFDDVEALYFADRSAKSDLASANGEPAIHDD